MSRAYKPFDLTHPMSAQQTQGLDGMLSDLYQRTSTLEARTNGVAGTYGDATHVPVVTVNAGGQISAISSTEITTNSGGSLVLLKSLTAASSAALDVTSVISATYDDYLIEILSLVPATDNTDLQLVCSTDNGATWDTGNNYARALRLDTPGFNTVLGANSGLANVTLCPNVDTTTTQGAVNLRIGVYNPQSASQYKVFGLHGAYHNNDGNYYAITGHGIYLSATAVNALRFVMSSGNIASGTIRIYGLAKTLPNTPTPTVINSTDTGTQNNWNPGLLSDTLIFWTGASDMTVTGFTGGAAAGQRITIKNTGSKVAYFAHQSGSSSAGNKLTNLVTSGTTPVATGGWIAYIYDGTDWQLDDQDQGAWLDIAYSAGNFTGSSTITWTVDAGDQGSLAYKVKGKEITIAGVISTTTVSGVGTDLRIAMPNSLKTNRTVVGICRVNDAGAGLVAGIVYVLASGGTTINFETMSGSNWNAATNTTALQFSIACELQ